MAEAFIFAYFTFLIFMTWLPSIMAAGGHHWTIYSGHISWKKTCIVIDYFGGRIWLCLFRFIMDTNTSFSTTPFKKTAIVLDRRQSFSAHSKVSVDLDGGTKSKNNSKSNAQCFPVYKSIWSCMTEASVEYSRVVYDLYPCQNLVRFNNIFYNSHSHMYIYW